MPLTRTLLLALLMALAACNAQPTPTDVPPAPTDAVVPTAAVEVPAAVDVSAEGRPTLPPTWTPEILPTPTLAAFVTLTPDGTLDALRALPPFPACATFVVDYANTPQTFLHQQPLTVRWGPAAGADVYQVRLFDISGQVIFGDATRDTSYTFPGELFVFGNFYGWEVRPLDNIGIQFCFPIGDDLTGQ